ncbi:hypothetical protein FKM82_025751 [Ascaphus truei]
MPYHFDRIEIWQSGIGGGTERELVKEIHSKQCKKMRNGYRTYSAVVLTQLIPLARICAADVVCSDHCPGRTGDIWEFTCNVFNNLGHYLLLEKYFIHDSSNKKRKVLQILHTFTEQSIRQHHVTLCIILTSKMMMHPGPRLEMAPHTCSFTGCF